MILLSSRRYSPALTLGISLLFAAVLFLSSSPAAAQSAAATGGWKEQ